MATQSVQDIPVELIDRSRTNPPSRGQGLEELEATIVAAGKILVPLQVFKAGKRFELDDGEGRWTIACKLGWKTVPAIVIPRPASTALNQLVKGLTQRKLSPWQTAQLVGACLKDKMPQKTIAEALGKSEGWVSKFGTIWKAGKITDMVNGEPCVNGFTFYSYTDADKLYEACKQILDPQAPATAAAGKKKSGQAGGEQLDLVKQEQAELRKKLDEIQQAEAEAHKVTFDQVVVDVDGSGAVHIAIRLSSLKAAQKAILQVTG